MHICPCSRALGISKNIGIRTYFGSGDGRNNGIFPPLCIFCRHLHFSGTDLSDFSLFLRTAFFEAHLLSSLKTWQLCSPLSYRQSHLGCHFRKLKVQSSNVSFDTFQWKQTFELWALRFKQHSKMSPQAGLVVQGFHGTLLYHCYTLRDGLCCCSATCEFMECMFVDC